MVNKYKKNQAKQINQTLDPYLYLSPIVDPRKTALELAGCRSQLLTDNLLDLSLDSVAQTIWHLINSHKVKPEEIAIVTSSSKYKEEISEELSKYAGTAGVKPLDVYELEKSVSESTLQSKIVPQWLPAFIAMADLPLIEESVKVKTALDFSEILNLLLNKGLDLKEKGFDAVEISKAIKERLKKEGDKSAYLFGYERQTTLNEKDIDSLVNIFQKFIRDYYTLKSQLGYVDIQDLAHNKQGKSVFDGKRFVFVLNVSDMTAMQQELIRAQAEKAGVKAYFLLASEASLYDFKGADPDLKAFKGNNLDFYLNFKETKIKHYVPPNEQSKMKNEEVNWNQLYSAPLYFAQQEKGKKVAIVTETNYQVEEIGRILTSQELEYNIHITLKSNKEALNIIAQAFEKVFESKVPKPEDTELLFKLLSLRFPKNEGIAIKTLDAAKRNVNRFWELYEKEPFQRFLGDKKVDLKQALIYTILTSNFYKPFIKLGNNENTVATVYRLPMEKFDTVVYVSSGAKGQLSATSLLGEEIRKLYHIQQRNEEQKRQDTLKVLGNIAGEVIKITGTSKASRPEIPRSKDLTKGEKSEIINTYDFVFNYFNNLEVVSFSMLKDIKKPGEFLIREILGYEGHSEPAEIGTKIHEIFMHSNENKLSKEEREALERNGNIVFLSNKEEIDSIIKRAGYRYVPGSAEQNIEIKFNELAKVLGLDKIPKTLKGKGVPDAIFEKQERDRTKYLIIDYKTGASKDYEKEYAAQLLFYKLLFSLKNNIPIENIETAVAYVGLRSTLDDKSAATYELYRITQKEEDDAKDFLRECISDLRVYVSDPQAFITELPIESLRDRLDSLKAFLDVHRP